jgi:hypothetical protein
MGADCFFRMGATHHVCQDYAAAGIANGLTYAALSDGCSSSPDTDFGARFMVQAFKTSVGWDPSPTVIASRAARYAEALDMPASCLDATLLFGMMGEQHAELWRAGDGVVAWRRRNGTWFFHQVAFGNNAPRYMSYSLSPDLEAQHAALSKTVTVRVGARGPGSADTWDVAEDTRPIMDLPSIECWYLQRNDTDLALMFSDGIESFQDAQGCPVPLEEVLNELTAIKGLHGQFLARRCGKFISKTCAERGWTHADDFSAAGIYLGELP